MKYMQIGERPAEPISHNPEIKKRVLLGNGEIPHITQYAQATFMPGQTGSPHAHPDMWEVYLCASGRGTIKVQNRSLSLSPGTFVVVEPGEIHAVENNGRAPLVLNYFGLVN
jgi:mannose-6-phosphate isomerase-like protein (cupin superfamily)